MADGQDATLSVDLLMSLENCTGRIASTGMCLGGHLVRPICTRLLGYSSCP